MQFLSSFSIFVFHINTVLEFFSFISWPGPPEINPLLKNQSFAYNSPLRLKCSVSGFPAPEVLWTKDGLNISNRNTLSINRVKYEDTGQYACSAVNSEGKNKAAFEITVTGKC